jgi:hypothetical protein
LFSTPVIKFQTEWNSAKPFDQIPEIGKIKLIRGFLPGGTKTIK